MDMHDDDFLGGIEFDLSPEQRKIVSRAINVASSATGDEFGALNPLISIMQWWKTNYDQTERTGRSPETLLTEACRLFALAHDEQQ